MASVCFVLGALARRLAVVFLLAVVCLSWGPATGAQAAASTGLEGAPQVECEPGEGVCDVDADRIPDAVEEIVCGSVTCATGREDRDSDGLADWVEVQAIGDPEAVVVTDDADSDGIPDFAEVLECGSDRCSTGRGDVDGDGVGDWAEVVICGDVTCADGTEDLDGDGVLDATELAACVEYGRGSGWVETVARLASTGAGIAALVLLAAALAGAGLLLRARTRRGRLSDAVTAS